MRILDLQILVCVHLIFSSKEEICSYSVKYNSSCYQLSTLIVKDNYVYALYHIIHITTYAFLYLIFALMHIGSPKGITLLEFEAVDQEDQEAPQQGGLEGEE